MINTIIFSKDRPLQLHLLLESLHENLNIEHFNINVLYKYTSEDIKLSYIKLISSFKNIKNINFINEVDFNTQLRYLTDSKYKYIMYLVDDDILYKQTILTEGLLDSIFDDNDLTTFSLRLGLNTIWCYTQKVENKLIKYNKYEDDYIIWNTKTSTNDYAYPYSLDGHIFKTTHINDILKNIENTITNPNIFEALLPNNKNVMIGSHKHSRLVNNPINRVQTTFNNISGTVHNYQPDILNDLYLDENFIIDLDNIDFSNVIGPHQEFKLYFKVNE